jgi:hypothetical protein
MNPPYNGNLHLKILRKTIQECNGVEIVCLHPSNYYDIMPVYFSPKNYKWADKCYRHLVERLDVDDAAARKGFERSLGANLHLIVGKYDPDHEGEPAFSDITRDIKAKVRKGCDDAGCGFDNIRVSRSKLKDNYILFNQYGVEKVEDIFASEDSDVSYGIVFETAAAKANFIKWFTTSKIIKWAFTNTWRVLLVPRVDWKKAWTDAELYEHFHLTKEEIEEIEKCIL